MAEVRRTKETRGATFTFQRLAERASMDPSALSHCLNTDFFSYEEKKQREQYRYRLVSSPTPSLTQLRMVLLFLSLVRETVHVSNV